MKKIISAFLCAVMVPATVVSSLALHKNEGYFDTKWEEFEVGDANGDGYVDMKDSLSLRQYCAGIEGADVNAGDINADGKVNAKDLLILKKCNAGVDDIEDYADDAAVDNFSIAGNDISEYSIVYDPDAKYVENMYFSADSLRKYINISTGTNLTVADAPTEESKHNIFFVDVTEIEGLEEKLGIESYQYEVKDGNVYIYGTRRGSMYAVFEIAEDYLGYRFYSDSWVNIKASRRVDIPEGTYSFRDPYLDFRVCRQSFGGDNNAADYHFFARRLNGTSINGYQEEYRGTLTGPEIANAHSYDYYWRMATGEVDVYYDGTNGGEYGAKYEVGFQQKEYEWNPCSTSDLEYSTLFRGLLESIRYHTSWKIFREETTSVSFSICDNPYYFCSCADCRFISSSGTAPGNVERLNCGGAGLNLYLANRACRDIQEFYGYWVDLDGEILDDDEAADLSDEEKVWEGRPAGMPEKGIVSDEDWYSEGYGEAITDAYPGMKLFTILYDHTLPNENLLTDERYEKIVPADNLIIMYCGNPCNNHYMGSGDCNGGLNILKQSGEKDAEALKQWGQVCKETGTEIWFWYYPVNYNTYLSDSPNIFNLWNDFKWMVEECNITGFFYEGGGPGYMFENLKSHLAAMLQWSMRTDENGEMVMMSYDEFVDCIKEYLEMFYGAGYEYIYEYIVMQDEAGNLNPCYVNNLDYPGDMFNYEYIRDNYEYMRGLILKALAMTDDPYQVQKIEYLLVNAEFLGLSATYNSVMRDGTDEDAKSTYIGRYEWMDNYIRTHGMNIGIYNIGDITLDTSVNPMELYYKGGTWKAEWDDTWIWLEGDPSWGYATAG